MLAEGIIAKIARPSSFYAQAGQSQSRVECAAWHQVKFPAVDFMSETGQFGQTGKNQIAKIPAIQQNIIGFVDIFPQGYRAFPLILKWFWFFWECLAARPIEWILYERKKKVKNLEKDQSTAGAAFFILGAKK